VQESHQAVPDSRSRLLIDQAKPGGAGRFQRGLDVIGSVGDVMQAGAFAVEKAGHCGFPRQRAEQLDVTLADAEEHGLDALPLDDLTVLNLHSKAARIERHGLVEVLDGHSDMIYAPEHGRGF
jgi:hypothetical protein